MHIPGSGKRPSSGRHAKLIEASYPGMSLMAAGSVLRKLFDRYFIHKSSQVELPWQEKTLTRFGSTFVKRTD